ncbi:MULTISPECIES: GntR family transcriptional regulator [Cohnella]|jgi:DNA-binding transcriptional regulator YhcF (GntR family)|uniref:GntR family transcriptional regulator n=1 Tax=Cohnella TaxID=329857 RepID=UPI000E3A7F7A|nr:GntR family transcriptional regulator [Cohnella sp.]REK60581.1 MAG: GntR family transcriptional regulator [Cohnella sp.]
MSTAFDNSKPIFLQIRDRIEDQIVNGQLKEQDQVPSTNQLVHFYKINHITVSKGINLLVEDGILYKKRGVGMFVAEGAREKIVRKRKAAFLDEYVRPMVLEAEKLGISESEMVSLIKQAKGRDQG